MQSSVADSNFKIQAAGNIAFQRYLDMTLEYYIVMPIILTLPLNGGFPGFRQTPVYAKTWMTQLFS
jgi:hypothetical protein